MYNSHAILFVIHQGMTMSFSPHAAKGSCTSDVKVTMANTNGTTVVNSNWTVNGKH